MMPVVTNFAKHTDVVYVAKILFDCFHISEDTFYSVLYWALHNHVGHLLLNRKDVICLK